MEPAEWKHIEAANRAKGDAVQRYLGGFVRPAAPLARSHASGRSGVPESCFPALLLGNRTAGRRVSCTCTRRILARSPDGQWWVLADRTQAPSGAGYALENRLVTHARAPGCVSRLARAPARQFFPDLPRRAAAIGAAAPRESAHRAAHAGPLQRNLFRARLYGPLPGLHAGGRRRSDGSRQPCVSEDTRAVCCRWTSSSAARTTIFAIRWNCAAIRCWACRDWCRRCGPATSPSPTRSVRALAESPAYAAFLPGLCRLLLGEELKIPTVATWWCGQPEPLALCRRSP